MLKYSGKWLVSRCLQEPAISNQSNWIPKWIKLKANLNYEIQCIFLGYHKNVINVATSSLSFAHDTWTEKENMTHVNKIILLKFSRILSRSFVIYVRITYLTVWITTNWKILQEMGTPDHLTCLLKNLYAGQEATVKTGHETTDWFQIGKGVCQGYILSLCLFNLHVQYIMRNAGLDEAQARIKIAGRNINNLRCAYLWQKANKN